MSSVINEVLSKAYISSIETIKGLLISDLGLSEVEANYITSYYTAIKELNLFSSKAFKNFEYDGELFDLNDVQKFVKFPEAFYDIVMLVFHNKLFLEKYDVIFNGITVKLEKKKLEKEESTDEKATPFDAYKVAEDRNYYTFYIPNANVAKEIRSFYADVYPKDKDIKAISNFFLPNWCIVSSQASYHFSKEKHAKSDIWLVTFLKENPADMVREKLGVQSLAENEEIFDMLRRISTQEAYDLRNELGEVYLMKKDGNVGSGRNYGYHNYSNYQSKDRKISDMRPGVLYSYNNINVEEKTSFSKQFEIEEGKLKRCFANTKVVTVPLGVTEIDSEAFKKLSSVEQVVLPPSVVKINTHAFMDMPMLRKVFVHNTLEVVESNAFKNVKHYDDSLNRNFENGAFLFGVIEKGANEITISKPSQLRFAPRELAAMCRELQKNTDYRQKEVQDNEEMVKEEMLDESFRVKRPSYEMLDYFSIEAGNRLVFDADPGDAVNAVDIAIPEGVEYVMGSLKNFTNLKTLTFSSSVKELKGLKINSSKTIEDLKNLRVIDMSQSQINELTSFKLSGLLNLRTLLLPKGLNSIDPGFFSGTGLETVFIPSSVAKYLEVSSFKNTPFLEVIQTDDVNNFIDNANDNVLAYIEKQLNLVEKEH